MIIAGVDGCKKGWVMVKYNKSNYTYGIYSSISELFSENQELERVLIDIPVGLASENFSRTVEIGLRKELKYRHSTVFNPPCREALYAGSDISARKKNLEIEGKSLSIQSLAIKNKIRETDEYLRNNKEAEIIESHPELCFKFLNYGEVLLTRKSTKEGLSERLNILDRYDGDIREFYKFVKNNSLRRDAKKDDIVDAICLCLVNKLSGVDRMKFIDDVNSKDAEGIDMKIGYYDPRN